jgi:hypothetical protein
MAALTSSRNTPEMSDFGRMQNYPVEANTTVYLGSMVALNANGNAVPATSAAGLRIVGRAERLYQGMPGQDAVNTASAKIPGSNQPAGAAGAISVICARGIFLYAVNDASIAQPQVGMLCFAVDDNSVSLSDGTGTRSVAGTIVNLDSSGQVWVDFWHQSALAV